MKMKKYFSILAMLLSVFCLVNAQNSDTLEAPLPKSWTFGGQGLLTFNQIALVNWAAGGSSNMSLMGNVSLFANYKKGKVYGENSLVLAYGFLKNYNFKKWDLPVTKSEDNINLTSKWGMKAWSDKVHYAALFNYRSQFTKGFAKPGDVNYLSRFMAPGYFNLSLGLDFNPLEGLSIFISPLSLKSTFVLDDSLAGIGAYGVNQYTDATLTERRIGSYDKVRLEMGARLFIQYKRDFAKGKLGYETTLEAFSNYLDRPQFVDVRWTNALLVKVTSWLSVNIFTDLIYDYDVLIPIYNGEGDAVMIKDPADPTGTALIQETGRRVQFKEVFGLGLTYKFNSNDFGKKKKK